MVYEFSAKEVAELLRACVRVAHGPLKGDVEVKFFPTYHKSDILVEVTTKE